MSGFTRLIIAASVAAVTLLAPFGQAHAGTWTLLTGSRSSAGYKPTSFAVADFDNDGDYDIAVTNHRTNGTISVLPGRSDGRFGTLDTPIQTGHDPISIVSGDFDSDGYMDIAFANLDDGSMTVMLGYANRTFKPAVNYPAGTSAISIVKADFNADGFIDLAVADKADGTVSVFTGVGDGTFNAAITTPSGDAGINPMMLAAGDVNDDGLPDLAVSSWDDATVRVLLGNGDGTFATPVSPATIIDVGQKPWGVTIADLDENGIPDIAVTSSFEHKVFVMLSDGLGGFSEPVEYATGRIPSYVSSADMNQDGYADLVVTDSASNNVEILHGKGGGEFSSVSRYYTGIYPLWADTTDFTRDGLPDLLVGCYTSYVISTFKGSFKLVGTFEIDPADDFPAGITPEHILAGDFSGDGFPDVVVTDAGGTTRQILPGDAQAVPALRLGGASAYLPFVKVPTCSPMTDFNRDGFPDQATPNAGADTVDVQMGLPNGTLDAAVSYPVGANPGAAPDCAVIADINNDGWPDILTPNKGEDTVSYLLNNRDSTFQAAVNITVGNAPDGLVVSDFTGDNWGDIAVANSADNTVVVLINKRNGTFETHVDNPSYLVGTGPSDIFLFDVDRDTETDLVVTNHGGSSVSILNGNGNGTFDPAVDYPTGPAPVEVAMADFDLNGWPDLAVAFQGGGGNAVSILEVHERSTFTTGVNDPAMGSISEPGGVYDTGTIFNVTATPAFGHVFTGWTGSYSGTANPLEVILKDDRTLTAKFAPGPYITGISAPSGIMDDIVTVTGVNFGTATGRVYIGSTTATVTSWSDTSVSFKVPRTVPFGDTGVKLLAGGKYSFPIDFTIDRAAITGFSVPSGVYKDPLTINGTDFGTVKPLAYFVYINSWGNEVKSPLVVTAFTDTSITTSVPRLPGGTYTVRVKNGHGYSTEMDFDIRPPAVTGLSAPSGVAGDILTITGTDFGSTRPTVQLSYINTYGREAYYTLYPTAYSGTSLTVTVPRIPGRAYSVRVKNLHGISPDTAADDITVRLPAITGVAPDPAASGTPVTITGTDFGTLRPTVYFVYTNVYGRDVLRYAAVTAYSDTSITVKVPSLTPGAYRIRVKNIHGYSNDQPFTAL